MESTWLVAAMWIGLALGAGLVSTGIGIATAISETIVGIGAQWFLGDVAGIHVLTANEDWVRLLGGAGASIPYLPRWRRIGPGGYENQVEGSLGDWRCEFSGPRGGLHGRRTLVDRLES